MCALVTGVQTCALPIYVRRLVQAEAPAEVTLLRDYDPSIPEITIDREQIIQAVLNVLRNALQAVGSAGTLILRTRPRRQVTVGGKIGRASCRERVWP